MTMQRGGGPPSQYNEPEDIVFEGPFQEQAPVDARRRHDEGEHLPCLEPRSKDVSAVAP